MSDQTNGRWNGIQRPYSTSDVARLRGSVHIEYSLARLGADKFWRLADLLERRGHTQARIDKLLGQNVLRCAEEVWRA